MPNTPAPLSPEEVDALRNKLWRVGGKVPLNVYFGEVPMFQCHTPEDALRVVDLLNGDRLIATVHDRERQRDEAEWEAANKMNTAFVKLEKERDELQRQLATAYRERDASIAELASQLDAARKASLDAERRLKAVPESLLCDQRDPCSYDHTCRIHKALAELRRIAGGENG